MSSRNLLNFVLLLVIAGLIVIVVYEPGIEPEKENPKLTSLKQDEINHIFIQRETGDDVELEKINGSWQLLKPYQLPAHDFRVQTILRLSEAESLSQNNLAKLDKATFGLEKPKATVTFNKSQQVFFGNNEPLQQHRYVQFGNYLHTITDTFFYQVSSSVSTFMDHQLLAGNINITKLQLPGLVAELKDGKWQVTPEPEHFTADSITELLNNWRNTQAIEIAKAEKTNGLQTANIYIKDRNDPLSFSIVKNNDGIALVRNDLGLAYSISEDNYTKLFKLPENIENKEAE